MSWTIVLLVALLVTIVLFGSYMTWLSPSGEDYGDDLNLVPRSYTRPHVRWLDGPAIYLAGVLIAVGVVGLLIWLSRGPIGIGG